MRNTGPTCTFPTVDMMKVASSAGPFSQVPVLNAGQTTSYVVPHDATVSLVLGEWWPMPDATQARSSSVAHCNAAISGVTRAQIPLNAGFLHVDLGTAVPMVFAIQPTMSMTVKS